MEDFESLTEKLARITIERDRLREENRRLRELLGHASRIDGSLGAEDRRFLPKEFDSVAEDLPPAPAQICSTELSTPEKISLFRSLFRRREDVYPVRFETANDKAGYSPACQCDWNTLRSLSKSEWKKRDKETRQLLPLKDQAVHDHLSGKITIGVYPLLVDETCWFLAVDFYQKPGEKTLRLSWSRAATEHPGAALLTKTMERRARRAIRKDGGGVLSHSCAQ